MYADNQSDNGLCYVEGIITDNIFEAIAKEAKMALQVPTPSKDKHCLILGWDKQNQTKEQSGKKQGSNQGAVDGGGGRGPCLTDLRIYLVRWEE